MFKDLGKLTSSELRDKKASLEAMFDVLKIVGGIFLAILLFVLCIVVPVFGIPFTIVVIGSAIIFAILRLRAINQELKKR